jgi:hypothetical protein
MTIPFYQLPKELCRRKDLESSDKVVFAVITDYQRENMDCWPGIQTLMSNTGLSRQTVLNSIERLEKSDCLEVIRQGKGKVNHYKTSLKIRPVEKSNQSKNQTTTSLKIRPELVYKLDLNKKDTINKTVLSEFSFVLKSKDTWYLPQAKLQEYQETFNHGLDVESELKKASQWLIDNSGKRKTVTGMPRFLSGWLGRVKPAQSQNTKGKENQVWDKEAENKFFDAFIAKNAPTEEELDKIFVEINKK